MEVRASHYTHRENGLMLRVVLLLVATESRADQREECAKPRTVRSTRPTGGRREAQDRTKYLADVGHGRAEEGLEVFAGGRILFDSGFQRLLRDGPRIAEVDQR